MLNTKKVVESEVREISFGFWKEDNFIEIKTDDDAENFSKETKTDKILIDSIITLVEVIKDQVATELEQIWERLDKLENNQ